MGAAAPLMLRGSRNEEHHGCRWRGELRLRHIVAPDDDFALVFPEGTDVAFIEDIERRPNAEVVFQALKRTWSNRIPKRDATGIHGIVFYQLYDKRKYYPTLRDEEAVNPDASALR
jgi:hypothetical protein